MVVNLVDVLYLVLIVAVVLITAYLVSTLNRVNSVLDEAKQVSRHVAGLTATVDRLNEAFTPAVTNLVNALQRFAVKASKIATDGETNETEEQNDDEE